MKLFELDGILSCLKKKKNMTQLDCSRKWGEKQTKANPEIQTVQPALDIL